MALEARDLAARGRVLREEPLRQARGAEREAPQPDRAPVLDEDKLDAAATDVDEEVGPALEPEGMVRGAVDEPCLLGARDDLHGDAGLAPEPPDERRAVRGLADGARRDGPHALDATRPGEARERLH